MNTKLNDLNTTGYCVIKGVYTPEEAEDLKQEILDWVKRVKVPYETHGVVKRHQVGHQAFQWQTRCNPKVQEPFKEILKAKDLVVSFDGIGYIPIGAKSRPSNFWMHTDQASNNSTFTSVQGLVALTGNSRNTFTCISGSHLFHEKYFENKEIPKDKIGKNWWKLENPEDYEKATGQNYSETAVALEVGDLLIWDSRLFHQNQQGGGEERLVQYVAYRPRSGLSQKQQQKRMDYFNSRRTTSHWAYPISVNSMQPQTYGDSSKLIDYPNLPEIDLENSSEFTLAQVWDLI